MGKILRVLAHGTEYAGKLMCKNVRMGFIVNAHILYYAHFCTYAYA